MVGEVGAVILLYFSSKSEFRVPSYDQKTDSRSLKGLYRDRIPIESLKELYKGI